MLPATGLLNDANIAQASLTDTAHILQNTTNAKFNASVSFVVESPVMPVRLPGLDIFVYTAVCHNANPVSKPTEGRSSSEDPYGTRDKGTSPCTSRHGGRYTTKVFF